MGGLKFPQQRIHNIERKLQGLAAAADDLTPIWPYVGNYLARVTRQQFSTKGRRSGDPWVPLAPSTLREKRLKGWPRSPLVRTGEMKGTLTSRPMEVEVYNRRTAEFGTNNKKAVWQHFGTFRNGKRHIPPRRIVAVTDFDRVQIARIIKRHLDKKSGIRP
jgi:phage gpG-like protein